MLEIFDEEMTRFNLGLHWTHWTAKQDIARSFPFIFPLTGAIRRRIAEDHASVLRVRSLQAIQGLHHDVGILRSNEKRSPWRLEGTVLSASLWVGIVSVNSIDCTGQRPTQLFWRDREAKLVECIIRFSFSHSWQLHGHKTRVVVANACQAPWSRTYSPGSIQLPDEVQRYFLLRNMIVRRCTTDESRRDDIREELICDLIASRLKDVSLSHFSRLKPVDDRGYISN